MRCAAGSEGLPPAVNNTETAPPLTTAPRWYYQSALPLPWMDRNSPSKLQGKPGCGVRVAWSLPSAAQSWHHPKLSLLQVRPPLSIRPVLPQSPVLWVHLSSPGANKGIGIEIARRLARNPQFHVILCSRSLEAGQAAAAEIGNGATAMQLDIESDDRWHHA
jgi:hypothetical protein